MKKILLVEDDIDIHEMLKELLENEHYEVTSAFDGLTALEMLAKEAFQLLILDLMLPQIDGISVLKKLRSHNQTPVLILSAKDSEVDKALGLGFGADDYVTKPFSMVELLARVQAIFRRNYEYMDIKQDMNNESENTIQKIGDLLIDLDQFSLTKNDEKIALTAKEMQILQLFIQNPKKVFTKAQIYESVWQEAYFGDENVINVQIRRLREKIETNPSKPLYIQTVWGIGYKFGEFK